MYHLTRTAGIDSNVTGYEYRRLSVGQFGDRCAICRRLTPASMRRFYRVSDGAMVIKRSKKVSFRRYSVLFKLADKEIQCKP